MFEIEFVVSGDYPWLAASLGLVGHNSTHPCLWCKVHKDKLGVWQLSALNRADFAPARNDAEQRRLAHQDVGRPCACCKKSFASPAVAKSAFEDLSKAAQSKFSSEHMGTYFQQGRVLEATLSLACFMHLHLMVVCLFWRYYVQRHFLTQDKADAITKTLDTIGVSTTKISKTLKKQVEDGNGKASENRPKRPSFNGQACYLVLRNFEDFLEHTHAAGSSTRGKIEAAINAYLKLIDAISPCVEDAGDDDDDAPTLEARRARAWQEYWSTPEKRAAQAAKVLTAARDFVKKLSSSGMPAMESVYTHYLTTHIGDHVREFGPLWFWPGEGLEHKNYVWKQTGRAVAQRGMAGHQNGGRKAQDGTQKRVAPGREGQTLLMVIAGEEFGGTARAGRAASKRTSQPISLL